MLYYYSLSCTVYRSSKMAVKGSLLVDKKDERVCCCCHVRTGTIVLGIWNILLQLLVIVVFLLALTLPGKYLYLRGSAPWINAEGDSHYSTLHYVTDQWNLGLIFSLLAFVVTVIFVYGTLRYRAEYLMPFFCIQVFDFCLATLIAVNFVSYSPNVRVWLINHFGTSTPMWLMEMDQRYLMIFIASIFLLILSLKGYLINMVWNCYKYIQRRNSLLSSVQEDDLEMALPPKYEEALGAPTHDTSKPPPPPYAQTLM